MQRPDGHSDRPAEANRMAARWVSAVVVLGACAATAWGQYPGSVRPATRLALPVSDPLNLSIPPAVTELPPVLAEPKATVTPTTSGLPCPIDYQPHHVYLPDQGVMWGTGGCDGECGPCRQAWLSTAFFFGCLQDLGDVTARVRLRRAGRRRILVLPRQNDRRGPEPVQLPRHVQRGAGRRNDDHFSGDTYDSRCQLSQRGNDIREVAL